MEVEEFCLAAFGFSWSACWTRCFLQWLVSFSPPRHVRVPAQTNFKTRGSVHVFLLSKPSQTVCLSPRAQSSGNEVEVFSAAAKCLKHRMNNQRTDNGDRSHFHNYSILYYYVSYYYIFILFFLLDFNCGLRTVLIYVVISIACVEVNVKHKYLNMKYWKSYTRHTMKIFKSYMILKSVS